jgi:hypothetical protein
LGKRTNRHCSSVFGFDWDSKESEGRTDERIEVAEIFDDEDFLVEESGVSRASGILVVVGV